MADSARVVLALPDARRDGLHAGDGRDEPAAGEPRRCRSPARGRQRGRRRDLRRRGSVRDRARRDRHRRRPVRDRARAVRRVARPGRRRPRARARPARAARFLGSAVDRRPGRRRRLGRAVLAVRSHRARAVPRARDRARRGRRRGRLQHVPELAREPAGAGGVRAAAPLWRFLPAARARGDAARDRDERPRVPLRRPAG